MAVLVCLAQEGNHSVSKYQWYFNDQVLDDECNPIVYITQCGLYKCQIVYTVCNNRVFNFEFMVAEGQYGISMYQYLQITLCTISVQETIFGESLCQKNNF